MQVQAHLDWMKHMGSGVKIAFSLADQVFARSASVGIYNVSGGLLEALLRHDSVDLSIFANSAMARELASTLPLGNANLRLCDAAAGSTLGRLCWDNLSVYSEAKQVEADWLFLPKGYASVLRKCPCRLAVYIHDIIPVIYRQRYPGSTGLIRHAYFSAIYKATLRDADVVFTNTEVTRRELSRWAEAHEIKVPEIVVVGYGLPSVSVPGRSRKRDQILVFARPEPHKLPVLAQSYLSKWQNESGYDGKIICVGASADALPESYAEKWDVLGRVSSSKLWTLLEESKAAVHFSEYEGFGMPPLEAVLAGAAPVYSDADATMEAMNSRGYPFSNVSYESFRDAMDAAIASDRKELDVLGGELRERHDWRKVCAGIVDTLLGKM